MGQFNNLFGDVTAEQEKIRTPRNAGAPKVTLSGCLHCPCNKSGLDQRPKNALFETVNPAKSIYILAVSPVYNEIQQRLNLVGRGGQVFWGRVTKLQAFTREQCNVDTIVRCRTTKASEDGSIIEANPDKDTVKCCAVYTEPRVKAAKPKVILLLGVLAQKQFLGKEYRKNQTVFWSDKWQCKIVCTYHPAFFLMGGATQESWASFDKALLEVQAALKYPSQFGYIQTLDYKRVEGTETVRQLYQKFKQEKKFVKVDFEWGTVKNSDGSEREVILCMGVSNKVGVSRVVFFEHPEAVAARRNLLHSTEPLDILTKRQIALTCQFLADPGIKKVFWHGVSDVNKVKQHWGVDVQGYDWDGEFGMYLAYPNRKNYTLDNTVDLMFKEMAGYKDVVEPFVQEEKNFALVPIKELVIRCGGDADATGRSLNAVWKKSNPELVKMYVQASFVLEEMGETGMLFDEQHCIKLQKVYGPLLQKLDQEIALMSGQPNFELTDTWLRWMLVCKFKLPLTKITDAAVKRVKPFFKQDYKKYLPSEVRSVLKQIYKEKWWKYYAVDKDVLETNYYVHPVIPKIMFRRFVARLTSTYLIGFRESARVNLGRCRTRFKLTGASSGRMSSGGDKEQNPLEKKKVNFQNIINDSNAKNILVSTLRWRQIVQARKNCQAGTIEEEI